MDPSDEALIRKFAGLQADLESNSSKIIIPATGAASRNWDLCLKACVCTDKMVFPTQFESQMRKSWDASPNTVFKQVERGTYLVDFVTTKEMERVLNGGPWIFRQDLVAVQKCSSPQATNKEITSSELWVQFHHIPLESLTDEGIEVLTNPIGTPLSDPVPGYINGRQFFKVKLLVPINKPLPDHVTAVHPTLGETKVYTVYERIGRVCLFCGLIGHEIDSCPDRVRLARIKNTEEGRNRLDLLNILKPKFGPWLTSALKIPKQDQQEPEIPTEAQRPKHDGPNSTQIPASPPKASGIKRNISQVLSNQLPPPLDKTTPRPVKKYVRSTPLSSSPQNLLISSPTLNPSLILTTTNSHGTTSQEYPLNETSAKRAKAASHNAPPRSV